MTSTESAVQRRASDAPVAVTLRAFQAVAYAEGGLLPAILIAATVNWLTGHGAGVVAVVGATHGTAFTIYILLVAPVARLLRWPWRTTSQALSVAFIPFAPWAFERRYRDSIAQRAAGAGHDGGGD